ncbi:hypothetical protein [Paenibacillus sp. Soil724D2]|uniref:hypothetical protein n=1 Tax=Paenibacillus sp. (strain Soil724D2) TaxID=1736392 RepID=UPI00071422FC|nr:hypothetical protein [Paenibacillus sp. Soil724D2]KRE33428.1 hypothetical protein ASG85_14270 [Paenibacillus sp. Soil724D2]
MVNNNDVVVIDLDRPRELRFGHKALKTYQAITGQSLEDLGQGGFSFDDIEKLVYAGLLSDARANGETLTLEIVEDLLDAHDIQDTITKMSQALEAAFGKADPNAVAAAQKKLGRK